MEDNPAFTLVLNHSSALRRLFVARSELSLGEAYICGDFDVEGDMEAAFDLGDYLLSRKPSDHYNFRCINSAGSAGVSQDVESKTRPRSSTG